jgi:hypothetical protein
MTRWFFIIASAIALVTLWQVEPGLAASDYFIDFGP